MIRSQCISSHGTDLVQAEYSSFIRREIEVLSGYLLLLWALMWALSSISVDTPTLLAMKRASYFRNLLLKVPSVLRFLSFSFVNKTFFKMKDKQFVIRLLIEDCVPECCCVCDIGGVAFWRLIELADRHQLRRHSATGSMSPMIYEFSIQAL